MSDTTTLELRVRLQRLAASLSIARSERDAAEVRAELRELRDSLDAMLLAA